MQYKQMSMRCGVEGGILRKPAHEGGRQTAASPPLNVTGHPAVGEIALGILLPLLPPAPLPPPSGRTPAPTIFIPKFLGLCKVATRKIQIPRARAPSRSPMALPSPPPAPTQSERDGEKIETVESSGREV